MVKISFIGKALKQYRGHDDELNKGMLLLPGDQATVSDKKADQLKKDFPEEFVFEKSEQKEPAKAPVEKAAPAAAAAPAPKKGKGGK